MIARAQGLASDPRDSVRQAAQRIRKALTRLGYCYQTKRGELVEISFRQLGLVSDQYAILEVDVQRLPPRVRIDGLVDPSTLHHLTAVVGRPVYKLNTTGLSYCIELFPQRTTRLPKMIHLDLDSRPRGSYMIPIGQGTNCAEWRSIFDTSHILVGGESRSGKSTWLNAALVALLTAHTPGELQLALVDPKGVEFTPFAQIPHLIRPVAVEPQPATALLGRLVAEMDRRRDLYKCLLARNLPTYNRRVQEGQGAPLPMVLAVIDEVSDIALQCGPRSAFYKHLIRLASKGAAFGIMLILATQNPKAEVLNTLIRGNLSTRIAFRVSTVGHSRTILGQGGAQDLPRTIRGRMLARVDRSLTELQGYYVSDHQVLAVIQRWEEAGGIELSPVEHALVHHALTEWQGEFPIGRLYRIFKGRISHRQLVKLGQAWESRGWLTAPPSATQPRQVTDELQKVYRISSSAVDDRATASQ